MADVDKLGQCVLLSKALWFLPPPARTKIAEGLYGLGVRVHPELATEQLMVAGPAGLGAYRPRSPVSIKVRDNMDVIRQVAPALADRMDAATTETQKQQLLAEIRAQQSTIVAAAEARLAALKPEDSQ